MNKFVRTKVYIYLYNVKQIKYKIMKITRTNITRFLKISSTTSIMLWLLSSYFTWDILYPIHLFQSLSNDSEVRAILFIVLIVKWGFDGGICLIINEELKN